MATGFAVIIREVTKHLNAFASGNATTVQADYLTATPTITQVVDPFFSLDFIKDKIVDAHGRLALEIANVRGHQWRTWITPSTVSVAASTAMGTTAANGKAIVGSPGQVMIGGIPASEAAPERVRDYLLHGGSAYGQPYLYYWDGLVIYPTVGGGVTVNVCTYERADAFTLIGTIPPGNITIPDALVDALVAGAVAECIIESKGMEQAGYYLSAFQKAIDSIRNGQTHMPMMTLKAAA